MHFFIGRYLIAVAVVFCGTAGWATPPLAAYGQLPGIGNVEISPDGTKWAAIVGDDRHAEIQIRETPGNKLISVTMTERAKVRGLQWVGPNHLLATFSKTAAVEGISGPRREWGFLMDYNVGDRKWQRLLNNVGGAMNVVSGDATGLILDGKPVVVVPGYTFAGGTGVSTLFRIALDTNAARQVETGNADTLDWVVGPDGKPLARADYNQKSGEWRLFTRTANGLKRVYAEIAPLDRPSIRMLGSNGDTIVVSSSKSGVRQIHDVSIADGSWSAPRPELDTDALLSDPVTHQLAGTVNVNLDSIDYAFLSASEQRLWRGLSMAFPGEIVTLASMSDDRQTAIVEVDGPKSGDAFYVVDRKTGKADFLSDRYPGVGPDDIAPVATFWYKAGDGMEIPAYLTLPRGRAAKALPLIVLAHGGPEARDSPGFDWWAQALASRGYAVLQPQFRGSSGFGTQHRDAGFGQWGRKMQTDLSDGVRQLARDGTIDAKRVCIVGASYGGYAALAGPTLDPGVYRCAAAVAGVSDLRRMLMAEIDDANGSSKNATLRYWKRFMGADSPADKRLDAISPARFAGQVNVPIQLIHGKDDTVVRYEQSSIMAKALRDAGKPVELVTLPGEDHWLSRAPTRVFMLTAMVGFLEKNNPPVAGDAKPAGR